MSTDLSELYRRWIDDAWAADEQVTRAIVTDDFVGHWPDRDVVGPDALVEAIAAGYQAFPDMTIRRVAPGPFVDGEYLIGRWEGSATNPQGGTMRFVGNDILRVRAGLVAEFWVATSMSAS